MSSQGSSSLAFALLVAGALSVAAPLTAAAQQLSGNCLHLQQRIARMQGDIVALQNLVNQQNVFMQFKPDPGQTLDEALNAAYQNYFTLGTWYDAETRSIYVVVTRDFMLDYFQTAGASQAVIQKALDRNESLRNKIQYGAVVDSLKAELVRWQADYKVECGSMPSPPSDCLLGVCPPDKK